MFSKELEALVEATLADGILEDNEKAALIKRAEKEGVDLDELEIYINSIMQKRIQNQKVQMDQDSAAHEKERRGNVCPHCGTPIPPMTKICPNCGQVVNSNETSGDKELFKLIDDIYNALTKVKASQDKASFISSEAECDALIKKANLFYGDNQKIQMLKFELEEEIKKASNRFKAPIVDRIMSGVLLFLALIFMCLLYLIPLFFKGFRNFLRSSWYKVIGKD